MRENKKVSQLDLAYALGYKSVSVISFGEIYKNKKHFNITQLAKIAYELDVNICDFFEDVDNILKKNKVSL